MALPNPTDPGAPPVNFTEDEWAAVLDAMAGNAALQEKLGQIPVKPADDGSGGIIIGNR